ncbi:MAG: MraY family glycosyltransferase [bacterium]|nr:MraY family glycosyltransferase [bacterium]
MKVFILIFIQFAVTLTVLLLLEKFSAMFNVVDIAFKEERKIHRENIPILGGVGIFFGILTGMLISGNFDKTLGILVPGSLLVFIGLIDDSFNLKPILKLVFQIISAVLLLFVSELIPKLTGISGINWVFGVLFIVAIINSSNMNDGFDGQLSMLSVIFLSSVLIIVKFPFFTYLIIPILVFLFFNISPARMFLGDAGSMLIGLIVAYSGLLIMNTEGFWKGLFIFSLVWYIPMFDLLFAVVRRSLSKQNIFSADKSHLHHVLLSKYKESMKVLWLYTTASVSLGVIAFLFSLFPGQTAFVIFDLIILIITAIIIILLIKKNILKVTNE